MANIKLSSTGILICALLTTSHSHAAIYEEGSLSIKPIMLGLGDYSFGYQSPNARIDGLSINTYKISNGLVASEVEKFNIGYSAEISYFPLDNLELAFRASYLEDRPLGAYLPVFPRSYEFNFRRNWAFLIGGNKYLEVKNENWMPYFGGMVGIMFQRNTTAVVYNVDANGYITQELGDAVLQPSKTRLKANFDVGVDYQFNKRWAISFSSGLSYLARPSASYELIYGLNTVYEENQRSFTIPFYVSLRNVIPPKDHHIDITIDTDVTPTEPAKTEEPAKTDTSAAKTEEPAAKTEEPAAKTETPAAKTEEPAAKKADEPAAKTEKPTAKTEEPAAKTEETSTKTEEPSAQTEEPTKTQEIAETEESAKTE